MFADRAEVIAVNRQRHRQGDEFGTMQQRPEKQIPVLDPLFADKAQPVDRAEERQQLLENSGRRA